MDVTASGPEGAPGPPKDRLGEADPLRADRLARIRAMIDDDSYETTERLEAAVCRLLSSIRERP